MTALPKKDRGASGEVLALLASDMPGERDAVVCAATHLLDRRELSWRDLLARPTAPTRGPLNSKWRVTCAELAMRPGALRAWERCFVGYLPAFPRLSSKQRYILAEIASRVLGEVDK
jgi:hypothetical protein